MPFCRNMLPRSRNSSGGRKKKGLHTQGRKDFLQLNLSIYPSIYILALPKKQLNSLVVTTHALVSSASNGYIFERKFFFFFPFSIQQIVKIK